MRYSLSVLVGLCSVLTIACNPTSKISLATSPAQASVTPLPTESSKPAEPITFDTMPENVAVSPIPASAVVSPTVQIAQTSQTKANKTEVPITLISFMPARNGGEARGVFIVPDRDTTRSAYGGSLRRYDVHIAKMFEVANLYCNPNNGNWESVEWNYFAGDGNINMGKFVLDCNLVRQVIAANGLGKPERTTIYFYGPSGRSSVENIPVLNLQGYKIPDFLKFVQQIKPVSDAERIGFGELGEPTQCC
jgi:hypothetical protein